MWLFKHTRIIGNIKLAIMSTLFLSALIYAGCAILGFVYNSNHSQTLSFHSLKLNPQKVYLFTSDYKYLTSQDTIIIPINEKNLPENLCTLYHNNGKWKLKLTDKLRTSNKDTTKQTILYPYCRWNDKNWDEKSFFQPNAEIPQDFLISGIRFNNASGSDRFIIRIEEIEKHSNEFYLTTGMAFFANRNVAIVNNKKNVIELDFCINGNETLDSSKYF